MINIQCKLFVTHDLFGNISCMHSTENLFQSMHFNLFYNEMLNQHNDFKNKCIGNCNKLLFKNKRKKKEIFF